MRDAGTDSSPTAGGDVAPGVSATTPARTEPVDFVEAVLPSAGRVGLVVAAGFVQLHTSVLDTLGREIVSGAMHPGATVSADQVAARLGVSRSVVREVVRVLESMGLLTVRRKVGITVQPAECWRAFDPWVIRWRLAGPDRLATLHALSELRAAVEPMAARLAADRATPAHCGALTASVIGMSATARAADGEVYLSHDASFHRTLLAASGNPMLAELASVVTQVLEGRTEHALMPSVANSEALRLHGVVASCVQSGDAAGAERAMREIVAEADDAVQRLETAAGA